MAINELPDTKTVMVEDSVHQQAGEGLTANHADATETPDIFDNSAQPAVKQVAQTVSAKAVAVANADDDVTLADVAIEGSTVTTPSANMNPNGVVDETTMDDQDTRTTDKTITLTPDMPLTTAVNTGASQAVAVEDSVIHQSGEGLTANHADATETPDIFDNTAQAALKSANGTVPVTAVQNSAATTTKDTMLAPTQAATLQQKIEGENNLVGELNTLSDGTLDIPRDGTA